MPFKGPGHYCEGDGRGGWRVGACLKPALALPRPPSASRRNGRTGPGASHWALGVVPMPRPRAVCLRSVTHPPSGPAVAAPVKGSPAPRGPLHMKGGTSPITCSGVARSCPLGLKAGASGAPWEGRRSALLLDRQTETPGLRCQRGSSARPSAPENPQRCHHASALLHLQCPEVRAADCRHPSSGGSNPGCLED